MLSVLEAASRAASAEAASAETSSSAAEASASADAPAEEAAPDEGASATEVLVVRLPAFGEGVATVAAKVSDFFRFHPVTAGNGAAVHLPQLAFPAGRAAAFAEFGQDGNQGDDEEGGEQQRPFLRAIRFFAGLHGVLQMATHGLYAAGHAPVPVIAGKGFQHVAFLYPLADGIGQRSLQAVAGGELHAAFAGDEEDDQPVVASFLAHAVAIAQLVGELEAVAAFDIFHGYGQHLDAGGLLQAVQRAVHPGHGGGRQDAVGVGDVAPPVLQMHHGNVLHPVGACQHGDGGHEGGKQQKKFLCHAVGFK